MENFDTQDLRYSVSLKEEKARRVLVNNKKMADKILSNVLQMEYLFEIDTIFLNEGL